MSASQGKQIVVNIWIGDNPEPTVEGPFEEVQQAMEFLKSKGFTWCNEPGELFYERGNDLARVVLPQA